MMLAPAGDIASTDALRWTMVAIELVALLGAAVWLVRRARRRLAREARRLKESPPSPVPTLPAANRAARRNATPRGGTVRVATPAGTPALPHPGDLPTRAGLQAGGLANVATRDPGAQVRFDTGEAAPAVQNDTLHCPRCGAVVRTHLSDTPLVARCVGCGRRVAARTDGGRLVVTVEGD